MPGHYGGPRKANSRGRQMVSSRRKPSTRKGGRPQRTRTTGQKRPTKTMTKVAKGPKKPAASRSGAGRANLAAYKRFMSMTDEQRQYVINRANAETRRKAR